MRNLMLAIAAAAFATLEPSALAAEGQGDNNEQPTMAELASKVDGLGTRLGGIEATLGNLATATVGTSATSIASKVDALSSTVAANHTAIVGKFALQMAAVMTKSTTLINATSPTGMNYNAAYYLVGESTIDDGFGIASSTSRLSFFPTHRFPAGFTFTDDKPLASYTSAFKITKLK